MTEFRVKFEVKGRIEMDVEAETEEEAIRIAEKNWTTDDLPDLQQSSEAQAKLIKYRKQ
jgi:hypothetical protein